MSYHFSEKGRGCLISREFLSLSMMVRVCVLIEEIWLVVDHPQEMRPEKKVPEIEAWKNE